MAKAKTCKLCDKPAMPHRTLCEVHYRDYQREYMRKKYKEEREIYLQLGDEKATLDPFIYEYEDGYTLKVRRISKTAGVKLELIKNMESYAIILPPKESDCLVSYIKRALRCEKIDD